ncbi:HEXXH motif-containing putative peptide modification protein [Streptomyces sp. NPDC001904]|uniref:aKG-HExxH-type peptide beta-hydroxylase n=1 Tax=Streptomyces sp. NPDC001904 TaxID=3154531 RepID=UPI00332247BB
MLTAAVARRLSVPLPALRLLGSGGHDAATGALLRAAEHSKRMLLLALLRTRLTDGAAVEQWALIEAAQRAAPEPVREVLLHPTVGTWAEETLRRLADPRSALPADTARLGALAAAAALRAGIPFTLTVHSPGRLLSLPSLGALRRPAPGPVRLDDTGWPGGPDAAALTLHRLGPAGPLLDDLDPYRVPPPTDRTRAARRLGPQGRAQWDARFGAAREVLRRIDDRRDREVGELLRCVVPLARTSRSASATAPAAHSAVLVRPCPPLHLAAALVHEVQHGKLAALSDLVQLHTADTAARHWAPWRPDPRPFDGLLHGTYAHLALADLWQRAALAGMPGAWPRHARYRAQVAAVLPEVERAPELTRAGGEFVAAMAATERAMGEHPPSAGLWREARLAVRAAAPTRGAGPDLMHASQEPIQERSAARRAARLVKDADQERPQ